MSKLKEIFPKAYFYRMMKKVKNIYRKKRKNRDNDKSYQNNLNESEQIELEQLELEWNELKSDKLIKLARRKELSIPNKKQTEYWNFSGYHSSSLNSNGRNYIKNQYRDEKKRKREIIKLYCKIFIGIVIALTGLTALLLKK